MSWINDDNTHEGSVVPEFADGVRGSGTSGGGVPADQVIVSVNYDAPYGAPPESRFETRPAAEVVGWRLVCDCRTTQGQIMTHAWVSDLIPRVPSRALEDVEQGGLYAADNEVSDVDETHQEALSERWWREHVEPQEALTRLREASRAAVQAGRELDAAVAAARAAGHSWAAVGTATGMARQSAHQRWGSP